MYFVRLRHIVLNLRHMILAEDAMREPEPKMLPAGAIRVTIETGRVIDFFGDDADTLRDFLDDLLSPHGPPAAHALSEAAPPKSKRPGKR